MAEQPHSKAKLRRVAFASCAGTTIEFYDFFIYGTAAALVFPIVFFPALGTTAGLVASFATFAVAFVARPLGAVIFGHYGDKLGRKGTLITTLLLMGFATVAIGLLPSANTIGIAAPLILVALRFAQGLAVGGEWAGANLLTAEYAPAGKRGFYAIFPQLGPSLAFALSSGTFLVSDYVLGTTDEAFINYGWRVPFLLSAVLVALGLYMRLSIEETPVFQKLKDEAAAAPKVEAKKSPFMDVIKSQPREILLSAGLMGILFGFFYMGTAYLTAYGTNPDGAALERRTVLMIGIVAAGAMALSTILAGIYSDRFGRRKIIIGSGIAAFFWSLALFPILDLGTSWSFAIGVSVTLSIFGVAFGPVGAYLPELFETRFRYTGAGTGYNLGGIFGGALPPIISPHLAEAFGSIAIGVMLAILAGISVACTFVLAETVGRKSLDDKDALVESPTK